MKINCCASYFILEIIITMLVLLPERERGVDVLRMITIFSISSDIAFAISIIKTIILQIMIQVAIKTISTNTQSDCSKNANFCFFTLADTLSLVVYSGHISVVTKYPPDKFNMKIFKFAYLCTYS